MLQPTDNDEYFGKYTRAHSVYIIAYRYSKIVNILLLTSLITKDSPEDR